MYWQLIKAVHTIFGHQFTLTPCPIAQQGAMLWPMWMDVPRSHLSLWVIGDARFCPSCIFLSLPFSLYTHNTHEIFTQSIPPWTISVAQLVPRVVVLRWRRRRIYAMYAISLLLPSFLHFCYDIHWFWRPTQGRKHGGWKDAWPLFPKICHVPSDIVSKCVDLIFATHLSLLVFLFRISNT